MSLKAVFFAAVSESLSKLFDLSNLSLAVITNGRSDRLTEPFRSTGLFWNMVPVSIWGDDAASPRQVQDKLDAIEPFGNFPWKEIEDNIARQKLFLPVFNFVNFHNTRAGARRFSEGVVQSRFHFPLTAFIKFVNYGSQAHASLRIDFDQAFISESMATALGELIPERVLAMVKGPL